MQSVEKFDQILKWPVFFFSSEIIPLNQFVVAMTSSEFTETSSVTAAFSSVEDEMPSRLVITCP